ncbi:hypothetical protein B0J18DRAFT_373326 [Chaetomium sp. MPI-SDFR-AT-0129]|nr:hypothetical protein B0J18DRAFT_373326 [Chaetomium sp. MPI-SDFR-AT-0129]
MAPVYADHPFKTLNTPIFLAKSENEKAESDVFDEIASEMVNVHNMFIRGLNSIYLQAPHIEPADEKLFARYILGWYHGLHSHHAGEEKSFFPAVERMTGVQGIMDTNKDQHEAFHDGFEALQVYCKAVLAGTEKYDGAKLVGLVDGFAPVLVQHLNDEIPTILSLRKYGDKMDGLMKVLEDEAQEAMKDIGLGGMVCLFANVDLKFENGMWTNWPPAPAPVLFLVKSILWWFYPERKFGAVDRAGNMQPLYAVPQTE